MLNCRGVDDVFITQRVKNLLIRMIFDWFQTDSLKPEAILSHSPSPVGYPFPRGEHSWKGESFPWHSNVLPGSPSHTPNTLLYDIHVMRHVDDFRWYLSIIKRIPRPSKGKRQAKTILAMLDMEILKTKTMNKNIKSTQISSHKVKPTQKKDTLIDYRCFI